jgi:hypothetical protein
VLAALCELPCTAGVNWGKNVERNLTRLVKKLHLYLQPSQGNSYSLPGAILIKHHEFGGLKQQIFILAQFGRSKV